MDTINDFVSKYYKLIIAGLVIAILIVTVLILYNKISALEEHQRDLEKTTIMTPKQATDSNYLQNTKDMNKSDADKTVMIIEKAQSGQLQPSSTVVVQAPSPTKATEIVKEKIDNKDPYMPKEAFEKSDRTIISEQPENKDYQVGVYKINLSKRWSVGTGFGVNHGDTYIPIVLERLYKNNRSIEIQGNIDTDTMKFNGAQIVHKWFF